MLGQGAFGKVTKALHIPSKKYVAIKRFHMQTHEKFFKAMIVEIKALILSNSPLITKAYGSYFKNGEIILPIEFIDFGSLK
jgi:serine/threonine protein kinase